MDENNFDNFENNDIESDGLDMGKTQEMDSLQWEREPEDEPRGITPRDEFTELNSADDMSRTLLMDSVGTDEPQEDYAPADNPVKKRRRKRRKKQTNHTRTMGQIFLGAVISVAAICLGAFLSAKVINGMRDVTGMAKNQREFDLIIYDNTTLEDIANSLYENNIILSPTFFKAYVNYSNKKDPQAFLVGAYTLRSNMSYGSIFNLLISEKDYSDEVVTVMIPEGSTAADIGRILEENYVCRAADFETYYRSKLDSYDFEEGIADNPNRFNALEGYLFPDTYEFYVIDDLKKFPMFDTEQYAKIAADTMYKNFTNRISEELYDRMEEMGMTLDETIILASLIQREGTNADNMSKISSVFHNRLNDPETFPQLQSDTTDTYIEQCIKARMNPSNEAEMQKIINAYDTYSPTCYGLPAGAICNPGLEAITAALYPAETDYKYFLASADGVFYYAHTLEQHEQNIIDAALHEGINQ